MDSQLILSKAMDWHAFEKSFWMVFYGKLIAACLGLAVAIVGVAWLALKERKAMAVDALWERVYRRYWQRKGFTVERQPRQERPKL